MVVDIDLCGLMRIDLITTIDLITEFILQVLIFHENYSNNKKSY